MFDNFRRFVMVLLILYFSILVGELSAFVIFAPAVLLGATLIHELTHWGIARIWTSDCTIDWEFSLPPGTAVFHSPDEIPSQRFQFVGGSPILVGIVGLITTALLVILGWSIDSPLIIAIVGVSGGLLSSMSESDEFAIRHPAAFQEYARDHDQWNSSVAQDYLEIPS